MPQTVRVADNPHQVWLFTGKNHSLRDRFEARLHKEWFAEMPENQGDYHVVDGGDKSWSEIFADADTLALFSSKRLIRVRNAESLKGKPFPLLANYVKNPNPHVLIFLEWNAAGRRSSDWRNLPAAALCDCRPLYGDALRQEVSAIAADCGMQLSHSAVHLILEKNHSDLNRMAMELEKLSIAFADANRQLLPEDIEPHLGFTKIRQIFELWDVLAERQSAAAIRLIVEILDLADSTIPLLYALETFCNQMIQIKKSRNIEALFKTALFAKAKMPQWKQQKRHQQSEGFQGKTLTAALEVLHRIDLAQKTGYGVNRQLLEEWTRLLCTNDAAAIQSWACSIVRR